MDPETGDEILWDDYNPAAYGENAEIFDDIEERADRLEGPTEDSRTASNEEAAAEAELQAANKVIAAQKAEEKSIVSLATVALDASEADELLTLYQRNIKRTKKRKWLKRHALRYNILLELARKNIEEGALREKAGIESPAQAAATAEVQVEDTPDAEVPISRDDVWSTIGRYVVS